MRMRGSATHGATDKLTLQQKRNFHAHAEQKPLDQSIQNFAHLITSQKSQNVP